MASTEIQETLPAVLDSLPRLMAIVMDQAEQAGFSGERMNAIELAFEEAIVNVVNHAYPDGPGNITVACRTDTPDTLLMRIEDHGIPFDPLAARPPDTHAGLDDRPIGGLGVFLIRRMMDEVRYERQGDRNILTLVAHRHSTRSAS